jgi:hypothetical protein
VFGAWNGGVFVAFEDLRRGARAPLMPRTGMRRISAKIQVLVARDAIGLRVLVPIVNGAAATECARC